MSRRTLSVDCRSCLAPLCTPDSSAYSARPASRHPRSRSPTTCPGSGLPAT
ncbi:hypothetical protein KPSA1_07396 [Pseudomonas syringae pv. actinidiae]|uniref:Uncharacterized protein n=1 Tax=Pseudomonas syringae pv. actinidiae TaxID=103796 RepID=A0A2V0QXE4_PSESF|nr:hypothetical protein KPSA1_07396 [Pseudomonas syringae pv. actinidiae]